MSNSDNKFQGLPNDKSNELNNDRHIYDYIENIIDLKVANIKRDLDSIKQQEEEDESARCEIQGDLKNIELWIEGTKKDIERIASDIQSMLKVLRGNGNGDALINTVIKLSEKIDTMESNIENLKKERNEDKRMFKWFIGSFVLLMIGNIISFFVG